MGVRGLGRRLLGGSVDPLPVALPDALLEWRRHGPAPLAPRSAGDPLDIAVVIPSFRRGSGGHATIADLLRGLEGLGHRCSLWLSDAEGRHRAEPATTTAASFQEFFGPLAAPLHTGFERWTGADVVVATGWQTVWRVLRLPGAGARAYLVQDHEPDFHPASAEALWAADSYRHGLHAIAASAWLAQFLRERYGSSASHFDLGADHSLYRPPGTGERREGDRVLFYARAVTPRRAVPLGLLALEELAARRPSTRLALFGESRPLGIGLEHENLGVLPPDHLAAEYRRASVGVVLSLTNPSRLHAEMLASGLPCVDLDLPALREGFGSDGALELAAPEPLAIASAIERLLDDPARAARRAEAGRELAAGRTWAAASRQVLAGLRAALTEAGP